MFSRKIAVKAKVGHGCEATAEGSRLSAKRDRGQRSGFGSPPLLPSVRQLLAFRFSAPGVDREYARRFDLYFARTPEQVEKDRDPLARRDDSGDEGSQTSHRTAGDDYFGAGLRVGGDFNGLAIGDERAQFVDEVFLYFGRPVTEMNHGGDTGKGVDLAAALEIIKERKEVAREKGFRGPDRLARAHPAKADPRGEDFEVEFPAKNLRNLIFLPWSGMESEPVQEQSEKFGTQRRRETA